MMKAAAFLLFPPNSQKWTACVIYITDYQHPGAAKLVMKIREQEFIIKSPRLSWVTQPSSRPIRLMAIACPLRRSHTLSSTILISLGASSLSPDQADLDMYGFFG